MYIDCLWYCDMLAGILSVCYLYRVAQKSKPLSRIVINIINRQCGYTFLVSFEYKMSML